jgi:quinoprotein glucose dehydrogenase
MLALLLVAQQAAVSHIGPHVAPYVAPASEEGVEAIARMKAPEGFQVKLWAAEPQLANPVAIHVTNKGEAYVAETFRIKSGVDDIRDHMDWLDDDVAARTVEDRVAYLRKHVGAKFDELYTKDSERVRWIGDTDGDGRADKSTVFAEGFNAPADGLAAGVFEHGGKVYFTCMPSLWELSDTDGDRIADVKKALSSGYGIRFALIGHDLHGMRIGPDGKLYFSCGDRGFSVPRPDGARLDNQFSGAVLRCNLDGSELEIFASGLRNPQELVFDELGELWTVDNNSDGGDKARLVHVVEGMDAGWRQSYQWLTEPNLRGPWNDEGLWKPHFEGQAAYIVPPLANICDGPSGLAYNPGTALGGAYANRFFVCDFRGDPNSSGVQAFTVKPKGSSFELDRIEKFLWGTLVTDCDFGPDGALWFSDWVQGWNKTGKGRIYRLEPDRDHAEAADVKRLLAADWTAMSDASVRGILVSSDQRVRFMAQFELVRRGKKQLLLRLAQDPTATKLARLHAIWGAGQLNAREIATMVSDVDLDPDLRAAATRVMGELHRSAHRSALGQWSPDKFSYLEPLLSAFDDPSAKVQSVAATALRHAAGPLDEEVRGLHGRVYARLDSIGENDPALRNALVGVLAKLGPRAQITGSHGGSSWDLEQAVTLESAHARMGALLALRRLRDVGVGTYLANSNERVVVEAARGIYDEQIAQAMPALASLIEREELKTTALVRRVLHANFRLGARSNAAALANFATRENADELHRWEAIDLLSKWAEPPGRDGFTGEWWPLPKRDASFLPQLVESMRSKGIEKAPTRVVAAWIELAERCNATQVAPALVERARDRSADASIRASAVRAASQVAPEVLEPALADLAVDSEAKVRAETLRAIQKASPERAYPLLADAARHGAIEERRVAYSALADMNDPRVDALFTVELARHIGGLVPPEVALDLVLAAEKRSDSSVKRVLTNLAAVRAIDPLSASFVDSLHGGDKARGKRVLREKAETSCLRCHKIEWGEGGEVGPDLRGLSKRSTRVDMLESIVDSNRRIARGYENWLFTFEDETPIAGVILEESDTAVRVRTSQDEIVELELSEIVERRKDLSAMPQDVAKFLTREEMRDLIEYLANL